jgi:type VI secretion system protein ImpK
MSQISNNGAGKPAENLALIFQELLTAIARLRSNRQAVTDPESFRHQIRQAVKAAALQARHQAGCASDDVRMATLAVIGFLDETILNLQNAVFADWSRQPMQEELFGTHTAGEVFFVNLEMLLRRDDSPALADVLEIYYLCLLLGYRGRYSASGAGELQAIVSATGRRLRRIRGAFGGLAPDSQPAAEPVLHVRDRWTRRAAIGAAACFFLTVLAFTLYKLVLGSGIPSISAGL